MEQYYEQNVVNNYIDERIKKTRTLTIAKTVCIIMALAALMTIILFITDSNFFLWMAILIVVSVPFIIAAIILGHINKRNNTEYDYVIDGEYLTITEIYFREQRKQKHKIRLRSVLSVGLFNSDGYKKVQDTANKKILALVNYDCEDTIVYMQYLTDNGKNIIFLEPDRGFMIALRRVVSAVNVFDSSMSEFENNLALKEKEAQENDISR